MTEPQRFAVIDAETDPFKHGRTPAPFAWGFYDGERFAHWWGRARGADVVRYLAEQVEPGTIVYAHNGGKFDFHFLLPWLDPDRDLFIINGRIGRMWLKGGVQVRDSFLLIPEALAAFQKEKIDYALFESAVRERHRTAIVDYLRSDCVYLFDLVDAFWKEHGGALTLPMAAMRRACEMIEIPRPRSSPAFDRLFRRFYYGGRCQAFQVGKIDRPFHVYDINSAYATAMLAPHPFGASRTTRSVLPKRDADLPRSFVRLVGRSHGALPMRHEDGSLSFPADELPREFFATGHELIAGLETRTLRIERVISCSTFHETVSFAPFIEHYWNERKKAKAKGDRLRDLVAKRTMNGVYGKLAQDPSRRRVYRVAGDAIRSGALEREGFAVLGQLGPWWLYSRPRPAAFGYLNVATAASITGAVRSQLLRAIASAEDPIYCDTDSLACGKLHGQKIGNGLGEWQLEAEARRGWIAGKKLYAIELQLTGKPNASDRAWKLASKGVQLAPEQIVRVAEGDPIEWASEVPTFRIGKEPVFLTRNVQRTGGSNEPARPFAE